MIWPTDPPDPDAHEEEPQEEAPGWATFPGTPRAPIDHPDERTAVH